MSAKQPEALWMADALETTNGLFVKNQAAAELRRLHAENLVLKDLCVRSFRALCDDDFPILREELCHFTKEENHHD